MMKVSFKKILRYTLILFVLLLSILLAMFFCRMLYRSANVPTRSLKISKGFFPISVWAITFSEDNKFLYAFQHDQEYDHVVLIKWDLDKNEIVQKMKISNWSDKAILCFDILGNEAIIAAKDKGFYGEKNYIYSLDLTNVSLKKEFSFYVEYDENSIPLDDIICGISFIDNDKIAFTRSHGGNQSKFKSYCFDRKTHEISVTENFNKMDWMISTRIAYPITEINRNNDKKIRYNRAYPYITILHPDNDINLDDQYSYPINSVSICNTKDYFAVVSSPVSDEHKSIFIDFFRANFMICPGDRNDDTIIALYRYSTGEKLFHRSYSDYPAYVAKISSDDKWLAVTVGGYVYVYEIDKMAKGFVR